MSTFFCPFCCSAQRKVEVVENGQKKLYRASCGSPAEAGPVEVKESIFDKPKVLCIDDDHLLLGLVRDTLEANGFEAITATDGPSGVEIAKRTRPDVILVDVLMPKVSGFEVCRRLRADPNLKSTPIIILTAVSDPGLKEKGVEAGANLAMPKPFNPMQVITIINKALALKPKGRTR
jgi:DNA-binding response OmpR family regulator